MFVPIDERHQLYLKQQGNGPPCLFLHGGPGYWSKSFQLLGGTLFEKHFSMIYLDQRGCGRSEGRDGLTYSLEELTGDIERIRTYLKVDRFYLCAHSFGGILAVNYARQYPQHIAGLILLNVTLNMIDAHMSQYLRSCELLEEPAEEFSSIVDLKKASEEMQQNLFQHGKLFSLHFFDESLKKNTDQIDQEMSFNHDYANFVENSAEFETDFTIYTRQIKSPVLAITGTHDYSVGIDHYRKFKFPNLKVGILNGGHLSYLENPDELDHYLTSFADAVLTDQYKK